MIAVSADFRHRLAVLEPCALTVFKPFGVLRLNFGEAALGDLLAWGFRNKEMQEGGIAEVIGEEFLVVL